MFIGVKPTRATVRKFANTQRSPSNTEPRAPEGRKFRGVEKGSELQDKTKYFVDPTRKRLSFIPALYSPRFEVSKSVHQQHDLIKKFYPHNTMVKEIDTTPPSPTLMTSTTLILDGVEREVVRGPQLITPRNPTSNITSSIQAHFDLRLQGIATRLNYSSEDVDEERDMEALLGFQPQTLGETQGHTMQGLIVAREGVRIIDDVVRIPKRRIDVIDEILEEYFDALLDEGREILHSIEGTILEEKIFTEFDEFMAMTADENFESESDTK
uniref:Reverse transcriptase domain-containing protein n=1 Tax=Tanacetum cinerariifolium TaxID=118510 RepID=A0A6L2P6G8_TANCI|nr:reverse transcriptase domain-containing protein [Tanacetum cinerariifolium]